MAKGNQGKSKAVKPKAKAKGNDDAEHGNGRAIHLIKVNEARKTATITMLPVGQKNERGEILVIVPGHIVSALAAEAYEGPSKLISKMVEQNIRSQVNGKADLANVTINLDVDKMEAKATGAKELGNPLPEPVEEPGPEVPEDEHGDQHEEPLTVTLDEHPPQEPSY